MHTTTGGVTMSGHPDAVHPTRRKLELFLIFVSAGAALIAAGLGVYGTTSAERAEDRRTQQVQRLDAYSSLLSEGELLITLMSRLEACTVPADGEARWDSATQQGDAVRLAVSRVFLVASDGVSDRAVRFREIAGETFAAQRGAALGDSPSCAAREAQRDEGIRDLRGALREFANRARAELTGDIAET